MDGAGCCDLTRIVRRCPLHQLLLGPQGPLVPITSSFILPHLWDSKAGGIAPLRFVGCIWSGLAGRTGRRGGLRPHWVLHLGQRVGAVQSCSSRQYPIAQSALHAMDPHCSVPGKQRSSESNVAPSAGPLMVLAASSFSESWLPSIWKPPTGQLGQPARGTRTPHGIASIHGSAPVLQHTG